MATEYNLEKFKKSLPFPFEDMDLLMRAFVHRSYLNERGGKGLESNERLEFLGDSVLSTVISEVLYDRFPEKSEGELTHLRARLVNRRTLARIAEGLDLGSHLFMGKGERATGGETNTANLAGVFEALLAAVYIEHGFEAARGYIIELYEPLIEEFLTGPVHFDSKPALQTLCQRLYREAPVYRPAGEEGPPHERVFTVEVVVCGRVLGRGTAGRKKDAEQAAAAAALEKISAEEAGSGEVDG